MKRLIYILMFLCGFGYVLAQAPPIVQRAEVKQIYKKDKTTNDTTTQKFSGDSALWNTTKSRFKFNKSVFAPYLFQNNLAVATHSELSDTAEAIRADMGTGAGGGVTPVDDILDWSTNKYTPYPDYAAAPKSGLFYNQSELKGLYVKDTTFGVYNRGSRLFSVGDSGFIYSLNKDGIIQNISSTPTSNGIEISYSDGYEYAGYAANYSGSIMWGNEIDIQGYNNLGLSTTLSDLDQNSVSARGNNIVLSAKYHGKVAAKDFKINIDSSGLSAVKNSTDIFKVDTLGNVTASRLQVKSGTSTVYFTVGGVLKDFYTDASTSGTGETDLYSYTVPANVLASNGDKLSFTVKILGASTGSILKFYFAETSLTLNINSNLSGYSEATCEIIRTSSTTCYMYVKGEGVANILNDFLGLTSKNWTTTNVLKITGQCGSGTITTKFGTIEYKPVGIN